jgi:hypothetical protein
MDWREAALVAVNLNLACFAPTGGRPRNAQTQAAPGTAPWAGVFSGVIRGSRLLPCRQTFSLQSGSPPARLFNMRFQALAAGLEYILLLN